MVSGTAAVNLSSSLRFVSLLLCKGFQELQDRFIGLGRTFLLLFGCDDLSLRDPVAGTRNELYRAQSAFVLVP